MDGGDTRGCLVRRRGLPGPVRSTIAAATRWACSGCACVVVILPPGTRSPARFLLLESDGEPRAAQSIHSTAPRVVRRGQMSSWLIHLDNVTDECRDHQRSVSGAWRRTASAITRARNSGRMGRGRAVSLSHRLSVGHRTWNPTGMGQVKMSPTRAADPSSQGELRIMLRGRYWCLRRRHRTL